MQVCACAVFILVFGIVFNSHVMKKLGAPKLPNRTSGYVSLGSFAVMAFSGYLLQITMHEWWLQALVVTHVASGAVFSLVYGVHLLIMLRLARARDRQGSVALEVAWGD